VTSQILHDTTITIEANKNVTLMLVGSMAPGGKVRFVQIDDDPGNVPNTKVAVRVVNASQTGAAPAPADAYILTDTTSTTLPAAPAFAAVGALSASPYVQRDPGAFAIRATAAGSTAASWGSIAPAGAAANGLIGTAAGFLGTGSAISAYIFPRSVAGSKAPQSAAFQNPAVVFFVDYIPAPPK